MRHKTVMYKRKWAIVLIIISTISYSSSLAGPVQGINAIRLERPETPFILNLNQTSDGFNIYYDENEHYMSASLFSETLEPMLYTPGYKVVLDTAAANFHRGFLGEFARTFQEPNLFITRDRERAAKKLSDATYFLKPTSHMRFIEEAESVIEYKQAIKLMNERAPLGNFAIFLAHGDEEGQLHRRVQKLLSQGVFRNKHVIARVCCIHSTYLPDLAEQMLEGNELAPLSVTYSVTSAVSVPYSVLEMYYVTTHPDLMKSPSELAVDGTTPKQILISINQRLKTFLQDYRQREEFEHEMKRWWANLIGEKDVHKVPQEIRHLVERLYKDKREYLDRYIEKQNNEHGISMDPVQEVSLHLYIKMSLDFSI